MRGSSVPPAAEVAPLFRVRDPDAWLGFFASLVIAFSCVQVLLFSFGRDQGIYAVVADGLLDGLVPYRDVWDFKPPGIFFAYALAQALFGRSELAPRLLEVIGLLASVAGFMTLSQTLFGKRQIGLVAGAVAALVHAELEFWHTAQPETFGGFLTVGALVLATSDANRRRYWIWGGVGLLFGLAFLFKPPLGGGLLVCAPYLVKREIERTRRPRSAIWPLAGMLGGFVMPIALCALWFVGRGGFGALVWTLFEFTPGYTTLSWEDRSAPAMLYHALEEAFFKFSALAAAGVIAAIVTTPIHGREREGLFLAFGVLSIQIAGVAMQGKFFPYHYGASLVLIAFVAGLGLYKLWRRCLAGGAGGVLAFAAFVVVAVAMRDAARDLPQGFWERCLIRSKYLLRVAPYTSRVELDRELYRVADYSLGADREVALEIRSRTRSGTPIYIWGFEPTIYWLAQRPAASRFIYNVPQRTEWERDYARRALMRELESTPPALIVVQRNDVFPAVTGRITDSRQELETFPELQQLLSTRYRPIEEIEDFELYQLSIDKSAAPNPNLAAPQPAHEFEPAASSQLPPPVQPP
jgi:hypothetical protein